MTQPTNAQDAAPQLAVERSGAGPAVVMIHGLGGTSNVWYPQIEELADRHTLVRIDLEGSGRSITRRRLSVDSWVAGIAAVLEAQGVERAHFFGHSLGTLVIQHFAATYPDRVAGLALLGVNRAPEAARRQTVRDRAAKVRAEGMLGIADGVLKAALSEHTRRDKPEVAAFVRELLLRQDPEGYALSCEAVAESVGADLARIACPVLLIAGSDDTISPVAASEKMASELRSAKLVVLEKCGHWMTIEKPQEVTRSLAHFLNG